MSNKLIEESRTSKATIGHAGLGMRGGTVMSPAFAVHDGDTVFTRALTNISARFLGVDTPEVAFTLPGDTNPTPISSPDWETFLSDPFADWPDAKQALGADLFTFLTDRTEPGTATNHAAHAAAAEKALQERIVADVEQFSAGDRDRFVFFLRYAKDVIDRYGRLLAYLTVNVANPVDAPALSYNEFMLESGLAAPYFIWPNLDPFKKQPTLLDAVPAPADIAAIAGSGRLKKARDFVAAARANGLGIFGTDSLRLQPFELRLIAGQRAPDRWVIDLSTDSGILLPPRDYHRIGDLEDRLYVAAEYVPLFETTGWTRGV